MKKNTKGKGGLGFYSVLTIVFIILKLLDKITWSWVWVVSPLWLPWVVAFAFCLVCGIIAKILNR